MKRWAAEPTGVNKRRIAPEERDEDGMIGASGGGGVRENKQDEEGREGSK